MSDTTQLKLPLLAPSQAQKHVTVNEALTMLDSLVQLSVKSAVLNGPPALPFEGDRYIVGPAPIGAWSGMAKQLAVWASGSWVFRAPVAGWIAWSEAAAKALVYAAGNWQDLSSGSFGNSVPELGINTVPDATNKFAFLGTNALMTSAASIDLALNKAGVGNDASLSFKRGFSARAIFGLLGDDNFSLKVSGNGTTFNTPLILNAATGKISAADITVDGMVLSDATDPTKKGGFSLAAVTSGVTQTYTLPNSSQTLAHIGAGAQTFSGSVTFSNASVSIGNSVATATYDLGSGATTSGLVKTLNIGAGGLSGSTTVVNIGSSVSGAGGSVVVNSPTVTFANSVTAVSMPQATVAANRLGLGGATADATNRLSINSPAVLLNNAGTSLDVTVNKAAAANDASVSFKTGFSVRALFGLLASDDLSLKVSPDGTVFFDGLTIDRTTGRVSLPQGAAYGALVSDPATPQDGLLWYNSTTAQLRARLGGSTRIMAPDSIAFQQPGTGDFLATTMGAGSTLGTLVGAANRIDLYPFIPRGDIIIDQVALSVATAVATAQGKILIYAANGSGQPTTRLFESAALDFSTVGFKTATVTLTLRKGLTYWIGVRHSSTATLTAYAVSATPDLTTADLTTQTRKLLRRTVTFATAAPDPWGFVNTETANAVASAVWFRSA